MSDYPRHQFNAGGCTKCGQDFMRASMACPGAPTAENAHKSMNALASEAMAKADKKMIKAPLYWEPVVRPGVNEKPLFNIDPASYELWNKAQPPVRVRLRDMQGGWGGIDMEPANLNRHVFFDEACAAHKAGLKHLYRASPNADIYEGTPQLVAAIRDWRAGPRALKLDEYLRRCRLNEPVRGARSVDMGADYD